MLSEIHVKNISGHCVQDKSQPKLAILVASMKKLFFSSLGIIFFTTVYSQGLIGGTVTDAETKLPLEGASVFAQNTTAGTITKNDGTYKLYLNKGGYEVIFSYTGYTTRSIKLEANSDQAFDIALQKEDKTMSEVVIMTSNEVTDGWDKYGKFFTAHFLGTTPFAKQAVLRNPEALKFFYYRKSDRLKILATEPLLIADSALGYDMRYSLDSFVYHYKTDINSYRGNCFYQEMSGDSVQIKTWKQNRVSAYYGSRLHFLRSYYDSTLVEEGFSLEIQPAPNVNKFTRLKSAYDTSYYFVDDSTGDIELWFPATLSIAYTKAKPDPSYLKEMGLPAYQKYQITYVDLTDSILVKENGYFTEQRSWINQGYWSWKNLADQLPFDYHPE
jgi:hypothetical protein